MNVIKKSNKKFWRVLLFLYVVAIVLFVLLKVQNGNIFENKPNGIMVNLVPFATIERYLNARDTIFITAFSNLVFNVLVFVPMGVLLPMASDKCCVWKFVISLFWCFCFVMFIECTQYFLGIGIFDVDDIILNMLGFLIGYLLYIIWGRDKSKE